MQEKQSQSERLDEMRQELLREREKYRYNIDDPVDPVQNRSGVRHILRAALVAAAILAALAVLISAVALANTGEPAGFAALFR